MKQNKPDGRCATCPRWDRWHIRIPNPKDQQKLIELYRRSGAKTKSDFLRARLLDESFKVIIEDESTEEYLRQLDSIITKLRVIGVSYNEAVKTLNSYHTVTTAHSLQPNSEGYQQLPLGQGCTGTASTVRAVLPANNHPRATGY